MKYGLWTVACATALAGVAVPAAAANILVNPGFESGALSPWFQDKDFSTGTNWFVTDADAHSGNFSAQDTGNKSLRQNFAGVATSSINTVSFWIKHPVQGGGTDVAYDFFYSDSTSAEFILNTSGLNWQLFDVTSQLAAGKTLTGFSVFGNSSGGNTITRLDDLLIDVGAGVPEPATWAMMLGGLGLAGAAMRRRKPAPILS